MGPDRIELRGLRVLGVHGALPEEQDRAQPFEIDLDVEADLSVAGASDDLADTVDYGAITAVAAAVVGGERFRLLERLAERIASEVAGVDPRIRAVTVTVRKLRPPLPVDLTSAGVRVTRRPQPRERRRAFLGLGSNLGDRVGTLRIAVAGLPDVVAVSPVYETEPVGGPDDQPPYLNLVVELSTDLSARQLLEIGQQLEAAAGRVRAERDGPRDPRRRRPPGGRRGASTRQTSPSPTPGCTSAGSCSLPWPTSPPTRPRRVGGVCDRRRAAGR